ncbi:MAG: DUF4266 domain-containing protein [Gammaproteobacteria bacterium]|nr:DUF4266 domain-containing protein [Gammaproteobacteria bacterium]
MKIFLIPALLLVLVSGCAEVKPWHRNILAQRDMQLVPDKIEAYIDDHIYFSKEASTGGSGIGGGGCGCN